MILIILHWSLFIMKPTCWDIVTLWARMCNKIFYVPMQWPKAKLAQSISHSTPNYCQLKNITNIQQMKYKRRETVFDRRLNIKNVMFWNSQIKWQENEPPLPHTLSTPKYTLINCSCYHIIVPCLLSHTSSSSQLQIEMLLLYSGPNLGPTVCLTQSGRWQATLAVAQLPEQRHKTELNLGLQVPRDTDKVSSF